MAGAIPERQQNRLTSQLVGTAGVDTSASRFFGGVARTSQEFTQIEQKKQLEQRRITARTDALRKKAVVDSRSAMGIVDFNNELDKLKSESKDINDYSEKAKALLQDKVEGIEDDDLRASFSKTASDLLISKNNKFSKDFKNEDEDEITSNVNAMVNSGANEISSIYSTQDTLEGKLEDSAFVIGLTLDTLDKLEGKLGAEATAKAKKSAIDTYLKSAIGGLLDSNPKDIDRFINEAVKGNKELQGLITPQDLEGISKYAADLVKAREREAKALNLRKQNSVANDWATRIANGEQLSEREMAIAVLRGDATATDAAAARKVKASNKKVFLGDNPETYAGMIDEFISLDKTIRTLPEAASLAKIAGFRQKLMESMDAGTMSMTTGQKWMKQITPKFNERLGELFDQINKITVVRDWAFDTVEDILPSKEEQVTAQVRLTNDLFDAIDKEENRVGRRLDLTELKVVTDTVKDNFKLRINSDAGLFRLGELHQVGGKIYRVVGFDTDMTPLLEDDLAAPVKKVEK